MTGDTTTRSSLSLLAPLYLEIKGASSQLEDSPSDGPAGQLNWRIAAKLDMDDLHEEAETLRRCHTVPSVRWCPACGRHRTIWNHCDNRLCQLCAPKLAFIRSEALRYWCKKVAQAKHVVLTCRNRVNLNRPWVRSFQRDLTRIRRTKFASEWRGGCWAMEVTNESRGWHLHAHLLIDADWIDQRALSIVWGGIVGQDYGIVWVKDARETDYAAEVCKYVVKGSTMVHWLSWEVGQLVRSLDRVRTFATFGTCYNLRREFRDWQKDVLAELRKCKCGCQNVAIGTPDEYDAYLERKRSMLAQFADQTSTRQYGMDLDLSSQRRKQHDPPV